MAHACNLLLERMRQDCKFEISLDNLVRPCFKIMKRKKSLFEREIENQLESRESRTK